MAILELDKIIINKPDTGIHCTNCGGDLKETGKLKIVQRVIVFIGFRKLKGHKYQCENCKKKYTVI
jgi:DNA-directed RNA polymerase subunit RPC12/RpoP